MVSGGNSGSNAGSETSSPAEDSKAVPPNEGSTTLKVFCQASVWLPNNETDISSSPFLTELQKRTGVTLDLTAISGDTQQQFNLMVADGKDNLPDIIDNTNMFEGSAPCRSVPVADHRDHIVGFPVYIPALCHSAGKADGRGGVTDGEDVMFTFLRIGKAADRGKLFGIGIGIFPPGEELVGVALVRHIENDFVRRRIENIVQGNRCFNDGQIGANVTAGHAQVQKHLLPDFSAQRNQRFLGKRF